MTTLSQNDIYNSRYFHQKYLIGAQMKYHILNLYLIFYHAKG